MAETYQIKYPLDGIVPLPPSTRHPFFPYNSLDKATAVAGQVASQIGRGESVAGAAHNFDRFYREAPSAFVGAQGMVEVGDESPLTLHVDLAKRVGPLAGVVAVGGIRSGEQEPAWGVIAAPFQEEPGVAMWATNPSTPTNRFEPKAKGRYLLPAASKLEVPSEGGTILVSSPVSGENPFAAELRDAGYDVVPYGSAAEAVISAIDPSMHDRLQPGKPLEKPIVGVAMHEAPKGTVAAAAAFAADRKHFMVTGPELWVPEVGTVPALMAVSPVIGHSMLRALGRDLVHA